LVAANPVKCKLAVIIYKAQEIIMKINCYAALNAKQPLQKFTYDAKPLGPNDVEVKITHCGICHSDIHLIDNDWQTSIYPLVPGHEIVGMVGELGSAVKHLQKGQRIGIGWEANSCGHCEWCARGDENLCSTQQATCVGNYGGYADAIRLNSRFVFPIPDALSSESVAPLLCGGATVYSPLQQYITNPSMRVGVIGIGGLGHLALQFAHAFGCEVTAFSSTTAKAEEAKQFGADHFVASADKNALSKVSNSFDFILSTVAADLDWTAYVNALRPRGKLCFVGALAAPINISAFSLIRGRKTICGSNIGSCPEINEMLQFAARHSIAAKTESMPMHDVNTALDKVRANKARYRMVLVN
jgi:uncharacterized zinc-type alcohol dehydrogenase-like protein